MPSEYELHKKTGIYYREGSYDKQIMGEINRSYGLLEIKKTDIVLDVGACFGAFVVYAHGLNPKKIIAIEPEKDNLKLLKKNCKGLKNVLILEGACLSSLPKGGTTHLYKTEGINHGNYSTTSFRGRTEVKVKTVDFKAILKKYKPTIIKMDCEGAEYDLLKASLPKHVRQVAIEIHFTKKEWRTTQGPRLIEAFSKWDCLKEPKITENNWHTIATWRR